MKKMLCVLVTVFAICALSACNTVHGFGKDLQKGGQAIQKASD